MLPCDHYRDRFLDHLYGLTEPTEAAALDAHAAGCPACAAAREQAARMGGLIARAARSEFPAVRFVPPEEAAAPVGAAAEPPAPRNTVHRAWLQWSVAVGLLLGVVGLGGWTARDLTGFLLIKPQVDRDAAALRQADEERSRLAAAVHATQDKVAKRLRAAEATHSDLIQQWAKATGQAAAEAKTQPLTILLRGPSTAIPGAPNAYAIIVKDRADKFRPVAVEAQVQDAAGKTLYKTTFETDGTAGLKPNTPGEPRQDLTLPASLWEAVKPGTDLFLVLTATDQKTKEKTRITERFRLLEPVTTTFLTTDKPMYRPGETVYFRSLTLDRARLVPPDHDLALNYALIGPNGQPVPGMALAGQPVPVAPDSFAPILGPDGKPVRGVGAGAFTLPANLPGGAYTLTVTGGASAEPTAAIRLATRPVLVNTYTPDKLEKQLDFDARTYGPGDVVQARLEVRDKGRPAADVPLQFKVEVDGQAVAPDAAPAKTDAAGVAAVRFTLPGADAIKSATLTVTATAKDGSPEALVRPVPLATRTLTVEFFPEGGDLVLGVPNRVYFRATTTTVPAKPADVTGVLTDGTKTVCDVKTLNDPDHPGVNQGLGVFTFTPEPGKLYTVKLARPVGVIPPVPGPFAAALGVAAATPLAGYELPRAKAEGVVLTVPEGVAKPGDKLHVKLWSIGKKRSVLVGAYTRGRSLAHRRAVLEPGRPTDLTLDPGDAKLGGVTRITVFEEPADAEGRVDLKPVAERLVFRQQGEVLKLRFDATRPGGQPRGAFAPGEPVELTVHAADETGRPTPAILWAAVVNRSVLAMADDKTERLMPTHFLLGGEVQKGEDLEHADFLLTDHPKAATGLDLLLGTQGWRRFAEQAPGEFRARHGNQAEPVLVAMGQRPGGGTLWRSDSQRVFDNYWPKYEAAVAELDAAEKDQRSGESVAKLRSESSQIESTYQARLTAFGQSAPELMFFDESVESRRPWLPLTLTLTLGGGLALLVARFLRKPGSPERAPLLVGALGLLGLGSFMLLAAYATGRSDQGWRSYAAAVDRRRQSTSFPAPAPAQQARPLPPRAMAGKAQFLDTKKGIGGNRTRQEPAPPVARPMPADADRAGRPIAPPPAVRQPPPLKPRLASDILKVRQDARLNNQPLDPIEAAGLAILQQSPAPPPPVVVRQYAHRHPDRGPGEVRSDFAETLLWQPVIVLPQDGKATLTFDLSDDVTGYRVLVSGHTLDGRIGAATGTIEVRKPLTADPKLPREVSSADKIDLPVGLTNGTNESHTAGVALTLDGFAAGRPGPFAVKLPANGGNRHLVRLTPTRPEGAASVTVAATAGPGLADAVRRATTIVADGFPYQGAKSDLLERRTEATVTLPPEWVPGTLRVAVTVYPNTLSELKAGLDGLMREPHGCFEQSSTANYPNVLIAEYLRETGRTDPELSRRARELMDRGYARLTGYECPKSGSPTRLGYEWFGAADQPHEALTAYGLLQFTDMARVYPVDPAMLARTRQYLLDCRDGKGGFRRNTRALDSFGRAPEAVTNAYIVWALTEADRDRAAELAPEIDALLVRSKDGPEASDPYFLALVANALLNAGRQADAAAVLKSLAGMQAADGSIPGAKTSITNSSGRALAIETTALALLGWQKANRPDQFLANVQRAVRWVCGHRDGSGAFGSTQSTILALKALIAFAKSGGAAEESGQLKVFVGGEEVATREFSSAAPGPVEVEIADAQTRFKPGETVVRLETTAKKAFPMSVAWDYRTRRPVSDPDCGVRLATSLAQAEVAEGDSVRLNVTVENRRDTPQGMTVAIVGLPAGLKLPEDQKQLKELTTAGAGSEPTVSYWETRGRELILYWRGMAPKQKVSLGVSLIAEVPGEYRGPASRTYLYYDADHKHWVAPLSVHVRAK